jgi:hypothetical protein
MADYKLFDNQRDILRKMVEAVDKGCRREFAITQNSMFKGVIFEGDNGKHAQIECTPGDLQAFVQQGLVNLMTRGSGSVTFRGVEAVKNNFKRRAESTAGTTTINIAGGVHGSNVQAGTGNVAAVTHSSGEVAAAILATIQEFRGLIESVDTGHREEVKQLLDIIESEAKSPAPSESKVWSAFQLLGTCVAGATALVKLSYNLKTMWSHLFKTLHG